jgi:hypothetical protein
VNNLSNVENFVEHPSVRRMREQFEAKYGSESPVMSAIFNWRNVVADFHRPYNSEMETPVTDADMDVAEQEMLTAIRLYGAQPRIPAVTDEMANAGYDAMRDPKTNLPAPWIVLGTAFKVFEAMLEAAPKDGVIEAPRGALQDQQKPLAQKPMGYWDGEFSSDGGATVYEVPQESVFGRKYRNIPLYAQVPQAQQGVSANESEEVGGLKQQLHIANARIRALQGMAARVEELEDLLTQQVEPVNKAAQRLTAIAEGVRLYGAPDKDLLAQRIDSIVSSMPVALPALVVQKAVVLTDEQILRIVPELLDCLQDPYDKAKTGNYYSSIPIDMVRLVRAVEKHYGIVEDECVPVDTAETTAQLENSKSADVDAALFKAKHQFLEWNRQQDEPMVKIAFEYGVFAKAIELYNAATPQL